MKESLCAVTPEKPKRNVCLDLARAIAIVSVIIIHADQRAPLIYPHLQTGWWQHLLILGVPFFTMLSGGLMLPKGENFSVIAYYKRYWNRILQFCLLIPICMIATETAKACAESGMSLHDAFLDAVKYRNGFTAAIFSSHVWYLYMITAFYLVLPFLSKMTKNLTTLEMLAFVILAYIGTFPVPFTTKILSGFSPHCYPSQCLWFLVGYLVINRGKESVLFSSRGMWCAVGCVVACMLILFVAEYLPFICSYRGLLSERLSFLDFTGLLILLMALQLQTLPLLVRSLAKCSFGIYLWHFVFMWIGVRYMPSDLPKGIQFAGYMAIGLLVPWLITIILSRIPVLRKLVI